MRRRLSATPLGVAVFLGVVTTVGVTGSADPPAGIVTLRLLGENDFHGNLQPPEPGLGGAATVDAYMDRAARGFEGRSIRVHAGDMVGASPLVSSWFHDDPSIDAMNRTGYDVGTLGNEELFQVHAYEHRLVRMRLTGADVATLPEQQWGSGQYVPLA